MLGYEHEPGKRNTRKIERKPLTLHTRIKRLARKTICFSKSIQMHDIVIGLFVNRYEFGLKLSMAKYRSATRPIGDYQYQHSQALVTVMPALAVLIWGRTSLRILLGASMGRLKTPFLG